MGVWIRVDKQLETALVLRTGTEPLLVPCLLTCTFSRHAFAVWPWLVGGLGAWHPSVPRQFGRRVKRPHRLSYRLFEKEGEVDTCGVAVEHSARHGTCLSAQLHHIGVAVQQPRKPQSTVVVGQCPGLGWPAFATSIAVTLLVAAPSWPCHTSNRMRRFKAPGNQTVGLAGEVDGAGIRSACRTGR